MTEDMMICTGMRRRGPLVALLALASMPCLAAQDTGNAAAGPVPSSSRPRAAAGFVLSEYAVALVQPAALLALPNGDLIVEEGATADHPGRALVLRDADRDGLAERRIPLCNDLRAPAAWLLRRDRLYRADASGLERCAFLVGQQAPLSACRAVFTFEDSPADAPVALAMYPDETRLLVLNGKGVHSLLPDGGDVRPVAAEAPSRVAAMAVEPRLARPWVVGLDSAPGDADLVVTLRSLPPAGVVSDAVSIPAAGNPTALVFYRRRALPPDLHGAALVALSPGNGEAVQPARIVAIPFAAGRPAGPPRDLLTGRGAAGFRPTAIAVLSNGAVVVADAASGTLWRLDSVP